MSRMVATPRKQEHERHLESLLNSNFDSTFSIGDIKQWIHTLQYELENSKNRQVALRNELSKLQKEYKEKKAVSAPSETPISPSKLKKKKTVIHDYFLPAAPEKEQAVQEREEQVRKDEISAPSQPSAPSILIGQTPKEAKELFLGETMIESSNVQEQKTIPGAAELGALPSVSTQLKSRREKAKQKKKIVSSDYEEEDEETSVSKLKPDAKRRRKKATLSDDEFDPNSISQDSASESSDMDIDEGIIKKKGSLLPSTAEVSVPVESKKARRTKKAQDIAQLVQAIATPTTPATPFSARSEEETEDEKSAALLLENEEESVSGLSKRKRRRKRITPTVTKKPKTSEIESTAIASNNIPFIDLNNVDAIYDDIINREKPKNPIDQFWYHLDKFYFRPVTSRHVTTTYFLPFPEDDSMDPLYTIPPLASDSNARISRNNSNIATGSNPMYDAEEEFFFDNDVQMMNENSSSGISSTGAGMTGSSSEISIGSAGAGGRAMFDIYKASKAFARRHNAALPLDVSQTQTPFYMSTDFAERLLSSLVCLNPLVTIPDFIATSSSRVPQSPDSKARSSRLGKSSSRNTPAVPLPQDDTELGKYEQMLERSLPKSEWIKLEGMSRDALKRLLPISDAEAEQMSVPIDTKISDYDVLSRETLSSNLYNELSHIGIECQRNEYRSDINEMFLQDDEVSAELRILQTQLREHRNRIKSIFNEIQHSVLKAEKDEIAALQARLQYVNELNLYKQNALPREE